MPCISCLLFFSLTARFELLNDGSLRACEVQSRKYAGRYRCDATNIYGSAWREVAVSQIHPGML